MPNNQKWTMHHAQNLAIRITLIFSKKKKKNEKKKKESIYYLIYIFYVFLI